MLGVPDQDTVPVRVVLRGAERLRHSFRGGGICSARLCLAIRNCSDLPLSLSVETGTGTQHPSGAPWPPADQFSEKAHPCLPLAIEIGTGTQRSSDAAQPL